MRFLILAFILFLVACSSGSGSSGRGAPYSYTLDVPNIGTVKYTVLAENGGRVSWYRGTIAAHNKIAYDAKTQKWDTDSRTDIYVMNADGSDKACITCNMAEFEALYQAILAQRQAVGDPRLGFWIGQPEWHPDGRHVVIQVENLNSLHVAQNFVSFGVDNDLWILDVETKTASRSWTTAVPRNATLHPRFSGDGTKLIFAQRVLTDLTNVWDGWGMIVADFDIDQAPGAMISNANLIAPGGRGLYETTGFIGSSNTLFSYSFTPYENNTVLPYVAEGRITDVNGSFTQLVVNFPDAWDEKPRYSPSTSAIVVMSSAFDTAWMPTDGVVTLQTDLYLGSPGNAFDRLSFFNDLDRYSTRVLVTDQEWNRTGDKLVVQVQPNAAALDAEVWLVELPQVY
jgi:Tol biopolymer transport system component